MDYDALNKIAQAALEKFENAEEIPCLWVKEQVEKTFPEADPYRVSDLMGWVFEFAYNPE